MSVAQLFDSSSLTALQHDFACLSISVYFSTFMEIKTKLPTCFYIVCKQRASRESRSTIAPHFRNIRTWGDAIGRRDRSFYNQFDLSKNESCWR